MKFLPVVLLLTFVTTLCAVSTSLFCITGHMLHLMKLTSFKTQIEGHGKFRRRYDAIYHSISFKIKIHLKRNSFDCQLDLKHSITMG